MSRSEIKLFIIVRNVIIIIIIIVVIVIVLLTQYCAGDKIEKNEMGWACGAYG